jgi:replicative DNA helicase
VTQPDTRDGFAAPPHDLTAEIAVLAAMMENRATLAEMSRRLRPVDFYRPTHGTLFAAMVDMFQVGIDVNHMSLTSRLAEAGDLQRVGGVPYIAEMINHAYVGSAGYHAGVIRDRATDRAWIEHAARVQQLMTKPMPTPERSAAIAASFEAVSAARVEHRGQWAGELAAETINHVVDIGNGTADTGVVPTGFADLDRLLSGGLRDGQLIIVAGRPGMGKSTLAMDIARHACVHLGLPGMFATLEMSNTELMMRLISAEAGIPLHLLRTGKLREEEWARVGDRIGLVDDAPLLMFDDPDMNLGILRAEGRRMKATRGCRLIVVDYLQLMSTGRRTEGRQQEVADLSRGLKLLGKQIGCPVIGVSQLNRGPEQRQDKKPSLGDLRDSGAIEQDADIVIFPHRPDYYDKFTRPGEADLIVAKHRNGPTATITVAAQLDRSRFVDMAL